MHGGEFDSDETAEGASVTEPVAERAVAAAARGGNPRHIADHAAGDLPHGAGAQYGSGVGAQLAALSLGYCFRPGDA